MGFELQQNTTSGPLIADGNREMLVDPHPGFAPFLPDTCIARRRIDAFAVLHFGGDVHGDSRPGYIAVAGDLEFLAGSERSRRGVVEKILVNAGLVFFPALVGERREVVEGQAIILGIKFSGVRGAAGTPRGAVVVDQLVEGGLIAGVLLSASAGKGQQSPEKGKQNIDRPVATRASVTRTSQRIG